MEIHPEPKVDCESRDGSQKAKRRRYCRLPGTDWLDWLVWSFQTPACQHLGTHRPRQAWKGPTALAALLGHRSLTSLSRTSISSAMATQATRIAQSGPAMQPVWRALAPRLLLDVPRPRQKTACQSNSPMVSSLALCDTHVSHGYRRHFSPIFFPTHVTLPDKHPASKCHCVRDAAGYY